TLLAADIDLARRTDEIGSVNLGLGREALGRQAAKLMHIQDDALLLGLWVKLHEIGIDVVLGRADIYLAVDPFAEGEIARFVVMGLRQDVKRLGPDVGEGGFRLRQAGATQ